VAVAVGAGWAFAAAPDARGAVAPSGSKGIPALKRDYYTSGAATLRAFAPVSKAARNSIVKINLNGETVCLGTVVREDGLVLTKASELKAGTLTCWLASEHEVPAELISMDDEEDLALVRVQAEGLKPVEWAASEVFVGEWAITPGIADTPHGVGVISALPRRIRPQRAFLGIQFDFSSTAPRIEETMAGFGAEKAGFKSGDVITAINGAAMTSREQVMEALRDFRSGQAVDVQVRRGEETIGARVTMMAPGSEELRGRLAPTRPADRMQGEVSQRAEGFEQAIEHNTVLPPWLCGGPLMNLDGRAIGLNIARAGRVATYALPPSLVCRVLDRLESSLPPAPASH